MTSGKVVHLKRDTYDVRIDRHTAWGNPFVVGRDGERGECIEKYKLWVITGMDPSARWIRNNAHKLYGLTLGCWCAPLGGVAVEDDPWVCHGQFLLHLSEEQFED